MSTIREIHLTADETALRTCYEIVAASQRHDDPGLPVRSLAAFRNRWSDGFSGYVRQTWLALDDAGEPAGCCLLLLPGLENPTLAMCFLAVAPASRRSGIGSALLSHCCERARTAGRRRLIGDARDDSPGAAFGRAMGATRGIAEMHRQLEIDAGLAARLPGLLASAARHAAGYSLVSWIGASPAEYLPDQTRLSAAMADAPRDDGVEPEPWDAERIVNAERVSFAAGQQFFSVAARDDSTGGLVAITQIFTDPGTPAWGFQMITAVLPEHRGHRLGLLVKAAMLELLMDREPGIHHMVTGNAAANQHMIAINEQLGFTIGSVYSSWELDLTGS
jgi:GNAT superfamily N-acetyltransferase